MLLEKYINKCSEVWGNDYTVLEFISGSRQPRIKSKLRVMDNLGVEYLTDPTKFIVQKKVPQVSTAVEPNKWFLTRGVQKHGQKYNYYNAQYNNTHTDVILICNKHNHKFSVSPNNHLTSNTGGCPLCGRESTTLASSKNKEQFLGEYNNIFNYDFSKFEYIGCHKSGVVICNKHGEFNITPTSLKGGSKCNKCARENQEGGYAAVFRDAPETELYLYVMKLESEDEIFYKIGLTKEPKRRSYQIPYNVTVLKLKKGKIKDLYLLEQRIIKSSWINNYKPSIKFSGYTECFLIK